MSDFFFKLKFGPKWEHVKVIRNFISIILSSGISDTDVAYKIAIAGSELMENACKYSAVGGAIIEIIKSYHQNHVELNIQNIARQNEIDTFKQTLEAASKGNAKEAYKEIILESLQANTQGRIGIARVRYECNADISYAISEDITDLMYGETVKNRDKFFRLNIHVVFPLDRDSKK